MSDPYKVLGISRDATDDEVKQAYRKLSRKYHPDANINNPNKGKAEEMFKLVGQAYNQIMDERKNGYSGGYGGSYGGYGSGSYSSGGYGNGGSAYGGSGNGNYGGGYSGNPFDDLFGGFGGFGGFNNGQGQSSQYYGQDASYYTAASNYINNRRFQEALYVLSNIQDRTAQWYFLSSLANNGLGNNVMALDFAKTALEMEPNNQTYQRLVQTLESGGQWYNTRQYSYGGDSGAMCCADPCTTLCLLNMCCC